MQTLKVPAHLGSLQIGDTEYKPNAEGQVNVSDDHASSARLLGCRNPDEMFEGEQVKVEITDDVARDMADVETIKALVGENEDLKHDNTLKDRRIAIFEQQITDLQTELARAHEMFEAATAPPATETATETRSSPLVTVSAADIDVMSYPDLKAFLTNRGVTFNPNITKVAAADLAKQQLMAA